VKICIYLCSKVGNALSSTVIASLDTIAAAVAGARNWIEVHEKGI